MTTSTLNASGLRQSLRASGITVSEIALGGRFHWHGHREKVERLTEFCSSNEKFRLPDASALVAPTRSNVDGEYIVRGPLSSETLRSILLEPSRWYETFRATQASKLGDRSSTVVSFGLERCVPPSLLRTLSQQVVHSPDRDAQAGTSAPRNAIQSPGDDIAVVGMACKTAGADDLDEFWKLLCEGKSQHQEVPSERFTFDTVHRELDPQRKWYGNFMNDYDKFDHKFFKKSPREATNMDPQQRQVLQTAYLAASQSGYFQSKKQDKNVGCYIGVCSTDYEDNMACHAPTAYTATGHLRGFIAGKISHFFGWTGPGLTIDTACSSSAVAVHQACRAILGGECNAAIAGGSHVMTSPLWYQNLAGASFLSKTGACKPFDADADGYCRGEAVAAVFLKKLSTAIADGDQIIGVISGTGVQQNENCTPIVVPNVPSLSGLFENVLAKSRLQPDQVTVVEAHGTGTPVGDPAEFDSVRKVFGGPKRSSSLALGSVKGLIGHCECTSGLVSLIKVLLMIQHGFIPPQASFKTLNPAIKMAAADQIHIPTKLMPWNADFRAALINNYGASGSNASIVVTQGPQMNRQLKETTSPTALERLKLPFCIPGLDDRSIRAGVSALRRYIEDRKGSQERPSLADLAFNLSRQSNRTLGKSLFIACSSLDELTSQLSLHERAEPLPSTSASSEPRPLILCFGGQISKYIGLDRQVYNNITIFRRHLDQCDSQCISLGIGSIFPDIFQRSPIEDTIRLQTCLFALQYSCARSWIDCGAQPAAVVGHSFGELTSLCVAGVLSLEGAIKMVAARARIIRDSWGLEKGAMMAVEAPLSVLQNLLDLANQTCAGHEPASIACYNSPTSFTVAGSTNAIDAVSATARGDPSFSSLKMKRLNVTHAFHSSLVDSLMPSLHAAMKDLTLETPKIALGRCTEHNAEQELTSKYFADHLRMPVFFSNSVQRLAQQFPNCVWIEAGSNSTITNMASRALSAPSSNHFQAVNITSDSAWTNLADATLNLWKAGLDLTFWAHHSSQASAYKQLLLPPYQFEKARHWLDLKPPPVQKESSRIESEPEELPKTLTTFVGYQDKEKRSARFRINTMIPEYNSLMTGHTVAFTAPICPATVQLDMVIESLRTLLSPTAQTQLRIQGVQNEVPICTDNSLLVWLDFELSAKEEYSWDFRIYSTNPQKPTAGTTHTKGRIILYPADEPQIDLDFARYERLTGHSRCLELLDDGAVSNIIQGQSIYRMFAEVVDYGEQYQGVQKVAGKGHISAGRVAKEYNPNTWFDAHLSDTFCQIVGIWANFMTDRAASNLYICRGIEQWIRSPKLDRQISRPQSYDVLALHQGSLDEGFVTDVFVFHPTTGQLLEVVLGVQFVKVAKASLAKLLSRLTHEEASQVAPPSKSSEIEVIEEAAPVAKVPVQEARPVKIAKVKEKKKDGARSEVFSKLKAIMVELSGVEPDQISELTELADVGIDSLMGMELVSEIDREFKITLPQDEIALVTDVSGTLQLVLATLGLDIGSEPSDSDSSDPTFDSSVPDETMTPASGVSEPELDGSSHGFGSAAPKSTIISPATKTDLPHVGPRTDADADFVVPSHKIIEAFQATKSRTDEFFAEGGCSDYVERVLPQQNNLCIALTLEAFEQMGSSIRSAQAGEEVKLFTPLPQHRQLVRNLCQMLEKIAGLIKIDGDVITRTGAPYPSMTGKELLQDPTKTDSRHLDISKLIYHVGCKFADCLTGKIDGVKLIFGNPEGRDLVSRLYGDWIMNIPCYKQMQDFLTRLIASLSPSDGPLRILEMGAGTGGTTKWLLPLLGSLNYPVEYTFTDLGPSFVAAARKTFGKQYPFMKFKAHDIEKEPAPDLLHKYHIVVSSNAVHATPSLTASAINIKKALLPNGILMMLEMIEPLYWIDMIFGLFEGWWLFKDSRKHALTPVSLWRSELQAAGFGHVDWTDGACPETTINKVIVAIAGEQSLQPEQELFKAGSVSSAGGLQRQAVIDGYVRKHTADFVVPKPSVGGLPPKAACVLVTGATGSTGCHLVANLARRSDVGRVVCLNRRGNVDPNERQLKSLVSKGIFLSEGESSKLLMLETDTAKPKLGLPEDVYQGLAETVTHMIHNAWVMSIKRPVKGFEAQFNVMRNLINLANDASRKLPLGSKINFEFVSSIAVVGQYPIWKNDSRVPEERMPIDALLPIGYADAKYICELMLDNTLHRYPDRFRTSAVRIGQIAGSKASGYWNPQEHLSFIWKSSQALNHLPALQGPASWTPVDDVAGTLVDLVFTDNPYPIYNIDNPVRQPWQGLLPVIADAMGIPRSNIVPYEQWVDLVRESSHLGEKENPASKLVDFLETDFRRMSCGGVHLQTTKAVEHSPTLAAVGPVSPEVTGRFFRYWRETGFLS